MGVPTARTDLSAVAASNSPAGGDTIASGTGPDDYLRAHASLIRANYDDILLKAPIASPTFTGTVTTAAVAMGNSVLSGVKSVSYNGLYAGYGTSGSITVAFSNGACQRIDPAGNITLAFTFPGIGWYTLHLSQGVSLEERITWPAASSTVLYVNRAAAPATMDANKNRLVTIYYNGTQMFIRIDSLNSATD